MDIRLELRMRCMRLVGLTICGLIGIVGHHYILPHAILRSNLKIFCKRGVLIHTISGMYLFFFNCRITIMLI